MNWFVIVLLIVFSNATYAISSYPLQTIKTQPDGSKVAIKVNGNEHLNWEEDVTGLPVIFKEGWYKYVDVDVQGNLVIGSKVLPKLQQQSLNKTGSTQSQSGALERYLELKIRQNSEQAHPESKTTPQQLNKNLTGEYENLVIALRWSDHADRDLPSQAELTELFNSSGGHDTLAPTGSIKDYFEEVSYGALSLNSFVTDWIDVSVSEAQASGVDNVIDATAISRAIKEALDTLDPSIDFRRFDKDNDNRIDFFTVLHSGYAAEFGGTDQNEVHYLDRVWSHYGGLRSGSWGSEENIFISNYVFNPALWFIRGNEIARIGVLAHELAHSLGLPDLYDGRGPNFGVGIGSWGLMANAWGFDGGQRHPPHLSAWSKYKVGWVQPTLLEKDGCYSLNRVQDNAEIALIESNYPSGEYLLIENRQIFGFDRRVPHGGLIVYHIDDLASLHDQGYPGLLNWPENGKHYQVSIVQADGKFNLEKDNNKGDSNDAFHADGVKQLGNLVGSYPNTNSYQNGTIVDTKNRIYDVSKSMEKMTFCVDIGGDLSSDFDILDLLPAILSGRYSIK